MKGFFNFTDQTIRMKRIVFILAMLVIIQQTNAQKNFQGEITYRLHTAMGDKPDATLKIYFGSNKIKLRFKEKDDYDKEDIIVLLDSSAKYIVNRESKTYKKKMLAVDQSAKHDQSKNIAGYHTTPFKTENTGLEGLLGGSMTTANLVFYLADSLYYNIPSTYTGNAELIAIQKNKIVLGADIVFKPGSYEDADSGMKKDVVTVEAIEIKPMIFKDDEFNIPAGYTLAMNNSYESPPAADTVMKIEMPVSSDTAIIKYPKEGKRSGKPSEQDKAKKVNKPKAAAKKD